jgi:chemotaxis signal transduction protein
MRSQESGSEVGTMPTATGAIPVHSLRRLLGEGPGEGTTNAYVIVMRDPEQPWGLLVERVGQVAIVPRPQLHTLPNLEGWEAAQRFAQVALHQDSLLLVLATERLLTTQTSHADMAETATPPVAPPRHPGNKARKTESRLLLCDAHPGTGSLPPIRLAFSLSQISEIREPPSVTRVPGSIASLSGLVPWRDQPLPVVEVAALAGKPTVAAERRRLVVARDGHGRHAGFLVQGGMQMLSTLPTVAPVSHASLPFSSQLIQRAWRASDQLIVILSWEGLAG